MGYYHWLLRLTLKCSRLRKNPQKQDSVYQSGMCVPQVVHSSLFGRASRGGCCVKEISPEVITNCTNFQIKTNLLNDQE